MELNQQLGQLLELPHHHESSARFKTNGFSSESSFINDQYSTETFMEKFSSVVTENSDFEFGE